jgi:predicted O-methyltransferase YrrM
MRALLAMALGDRQLLGDYVHAYRAGRRPATGAPERPAAARQAAPLTPEEANAWIAAAATGGAEPAAGPALALVRARLAAGDAAAARPQAQRIAAGLAGDPSLGELSYRIVRAVQPARVVETGVAGGVTSAYLLAGLADNGAGRLDSVDLPPLAMHSAGLVGGLVPAELRGPWYYHWGSSRRVLPALLRSLDGELDVFIHDSDHSYAAMRWELEAAWPALRAGGWLLADDVHHHGAFADVAAALGLEAVYVEQPAKRGRTGIIVKPAP